MTLDFHLKKGRGLSELWQLFESHLLHEVHLITFPSYISLTEILNILDLVTEKILFFAIAKAIVV